MQPKTIETKTRTFNANNEDGYAPLDIADVQTNYGNAMVSVWQPTPEEIVKIVAGEPILLMIIGNVMPPVAVGVGLDFQP